MGIKLAISGHTVTLTRVETECGDFFDKQTTHYGRKTAGILYIINDEKIDDALGWLGDTETLGLDFETYADDCGIDDPLYVKKARPRLLSISDGEKTVVFDCPCLVRLSEKLRPWLESKTVVCHNAQFDFAFLARWDIKPKRVIDTMIMERVILGAEGSEGTKTLKALCEKYLDETLDKTDPTADWSKDNALSDAMIQYSARDAKVLILLKETLHAKINELGMDSRAYFIFCDAIPAIVTSKQVGMPIDKAKTQELHERLKSDAGRIERELILDYGQYGYTTTTANSPKKLTVVIQRAFGVAVQSTSRDTLTQLALDTGNDALKIFCEQVLSVRRLLKIATELSKYITSAVDGRIHANYRLLGAISGRTTSSRPNLQQVSKGAAVEGLLDTGEIRGCFVAPAGYRFVVGDYAQVELVLNAIHCGDEGMLDAFRNDYDIHSHTASQIFGKPILEISNEERQIGKSANFGLQYGMGTDRFQDYAKSYGIRLSPAEAAGIRRAWFESYPQIAIHHSQVKSQKPERVSTVTGRLIHTKTFSNALNLPIQGSGADLLNRAVAIIHDQLEPFDASIVAYVHDEIVVLVSEADVSAVVSVVKRGMADAGKDLYPEYRELIRCDVKMGQDWSGETINGLIVCDDGGGSYRFQARCLSMTVLDFLHCRELAAAIAD